MLTFCIAERKLLLPLRDVTDPSRCRVGTDGEDEDCERKDGRLREAEKICAHDKGGSGKEDRLDCQEGAFMPCPVLGRELRVLLCFADGRNECGLSLLLGASLAELALYNLSRD